MFSWSYEEITRNDPNIVRLSLNLWKCGCLCLSKTEDAWTLKLLSNNFNTYEFYKSSTYECLYQPHKSTNHERQDIPWENPPNMEDEKLKNSLSMIDRFVENGLQHIIIFLDKRYHHNSREERSNVTPQKQLYVIVLNFPYA